MSIAPLSTPRCDQFVLMMSRIQDDNAAILKLQQPSNRQATPHDSGQHQTVPSTAAPNTTTQSPDQIDVTTDEKRLYQWIHNQYSNSAFTSANFIGWKNFRNALIKQKPGQQFQIVRALEQ